MSTDNDTTGSTDTETDTENAPTDDADSQPKQITRKRGNASYSGPETGIDMANKSDLKDVQRKIYSPEELEQAREENDAFIDEDNHVVWASPQDEPKHHDVQWLPRRIAEDPDVNDTAKAVCRQYYKYGRDDPEEIAEHIDASASTAENYLRRYIRYPNRSYDDFYEHQRKAIDVFTVMPNASVNATGRLDGYMSSNSLYDLRDGTKQLQQLRRQKWIAGEFDDETHNRLCDILADLEERLGEQSSLRPGVPSRRETTPETWVCGECNKTFSNEKSYRSHERIIHADVPDDETQWVCEECDKGFTAATGLQAHMRVVHGEADSDAAETVQQIRGTAAGDSDTTADTDAAQAPGPNAGEAPPADVTQAFTDVALSPVDLSAYVNAAAATGQGRVAELSVSHEGFTVAFARDEADTDDEADTNG